MVLVGNYWPGIIPLTTSHQLFTKKEIPIHLNYSGDAITNFDIRNNLNEQNQKFKTAE